jgi:hypothetical protein
MEGKQLQVIELGARIQYFTIEHLYQAGIYMSPSRTTARGHLRDLRNYGWLTETHFGIARGIGKLHTIYSITPKASRYLIEYENHRAETIKLTSSKRTQDYETKAPADYFHRVGVLDSVLAVLLTLDKQGIREDFLELYFRRYGSHLPRRTAFELEGGRLEPDAVITFTADEKPRFYLMEFYEDYANNERIKRSLLRHAEALASGVPSIAMKLSVGHRVLLVFRHEHTARALMEWVATTPELADVRERFLFKTRDSIVKDAFDQWGYAKGERVTIY